MLKVGRYQPQKIQSSHLNDYEKLYSLDVLGVKDRGENDQLRDFKESVVRKQDGRCEVYFGYREPH